MLVRHQGKTRLAERPWVRPPRHTCLYSALIVYSDLSRGVKGTQVDVTVRVPLAKFAKEIALAYSIACPIVSVKAEGNSLVVTFRSEGPSRTQSSKGDLASLSSGTEPCPFASEPSLVSSPGALQTPRGNRR